MLIIYYRVILTNIYIALVWIDAKKFDFVPIDKLGI